MAWYAPVFHFAIKQFPNFDTLKHFKSSEVFTEKDSGASKKLGALQHQTKARATRERPRESFFNASRGPSPLPWRGGKF